MQIKGITDVFFDLDHTLWDFDRNSAQAFNRVFQKHQVALNVSDFVREYEPINLQYWKQFGQDAITKEEMRRGRLLDTFRIFNMEIPDPTLEILIKSYIQELPVDNHLFSGAVQILEYLSAKYRLHIITNGFGEAQYLKLKNGGIEKYFATITTSEEVGTKKPHPYIFVTALKKAAAFPENSIMIGDSYEADIEGAKNVGMHTLFFDYRNKGPSLGSWAINELLQIKGYL